MLVVIKTKQRRNKLTLVPSSHCWRKEHIHTFILEAQHNLETNRSKRNNHLLSPARKTSLPHSMIHHEEDESDNDNGDEIVIISYLIA